MKVNDSANICAFSLEDVIMESSSDVSGENELYVKLY